MQARVEVSRAWLRRVTMPDEEKREAFEAVEDRLGIGVAFDYAEHMAAHARRGDARCDCLGVPWV